MIIKPHYLLAALMATSAGKLRSDCDWADIATAGLVGAGIGAAVVYAASCADDNYDAYEASSRHHSSDNRHNERRILLRYADECYTRISQTNYELVQAYRAIPCHGRSYDRTVQLIKRKGKDYQPNHWFITSTYLDQDCKDQVPFLHGYAALLNECAELRRRRDDLIDVFSGVRAARLHYANFDNLEKLANLLHDLATSFENQHIFLIAQDNLRMYRMMQKKDQHVCYIQLY